MPSRSRWPPHSDGCRCLVAACAGVCTAAMLLPVTHSEHGGWMLLLMLMALADTAPPRMVATAPAETLAVHVTGAGRPVVLLPGLFGAAFQYRKVVPDLVAQGRQAIVIELLGTGESGRPKEADYSLTGQARRVGAVLDTLGLRGAVVVAHAIGGSVAMRLAIERPELVAAIVSIEGGPAEAATSQGLRGALSWAPLLKLFGGKGIVRGKVVKQLKEASADPAWITPDIVESYTAGTLNDFGATLDALKGMARSREPWVLAARLPEIGCPVLLLLGAEPHKHGPAKAEVDLLRDSLPVLAVDSVAGSGSYVFEERPAALVAAVERVELAWMVGAIGW